MPGLERELQGKQQGDQLAMTLPPEQTYGLRREDAVERIPIKYLIKPGKKLTPGMRVQVNTKQGPRDATLVKAGRFNADADGNHPFAGKTITFKLSVKLIPRRIQMNSRMAIPMGSTEPPVIITR